MNNIEKYKHLFVSVKDGLPDKNSIVFVYVEREYKNSSSFVCAKYNGEDEEYPWTSESFNEDETVKGTHWLDLDLLTTKKRAEELAESAYAEGIDRSLKLIKVKGARKDSMNFTDFLSQNKDRL